MKKAIMKPPKMASKRPVSVIKRPSTEKWAVLLAYPSDIHFKSTAMKTQPILTATAIYFFLLFTLLSCNKGGDDLLYSSNVHMVNLSGYNNSEEELILQLDTFAATVTPPFSRIEFG